MNATERIQARVATDAAARLRNPEALLGTPAGEALVARLTDATCDLYPHRALHVRQVALTVLKARGHA